MADEYTAREVANGWRFVGLVRKPYRSKSVAGSGAKGAVFDERLPSNMVGIITGFANSYPGGGSSDTTFYDVRIDGEQLFDQSIGRSYAPLTAPRYFDRPEWSIFPLIYDRIVVDFTNGTGGNITGEVIVEIALYEAPPGVRL
jgi:hypothetical protein